LNGKVPLAFRCGDTASGVATCTAKVDGVARAAGFEVPATPLNSTHTIELTAADRVGRITTQTFTYTVRSRGILYINGAIGSGDIFVLPVDAGVSTIPTRLTATSFPEADPVWSPDSRRIAFSSNRDGTWRIYLMDADGTDVTLLNTGDGNALDPAWSPDGNRIAFVSTRSGNFDIWVVNLNGMGLQRLTFDSKLDLAPSWTPTNQITWANGPLLGLDIWKMSATGSGKTQLTKTRDVAAETSSSPNGTIAFARRKGFRFEIWTMTASGGSQTKAVGTGRWDVQPSWLQDGKLVFASGIDENRDFDLYRATKSGSTWSFARITNAPGNERAPNG
jgi:Tol biopolymer transport system component